MKNFSDLPDTDLQISIHLAAHHGWPQIQVTVNHHRAITVIPAATGATLRYSVPCQDALVISLEFQGPENSSALIQSIQVDDFDFVPGYTHWATYHGTPTTHLDQPGSWQIRLEQPFYCWLHHVTGQGWLFD